LDSEPAFISSIQTAMGLPWRCSMPRIWAVMPSAGSAIGVLSGRVVGCLRRGVVREGPFGRVAGEGERALVGDPGLAGATEIAQRLRAGGVEQVVARQRAGQGIELGQCHGRAGDLAQRDRPV
jgi:hypothetical protein